MGIQERRKKENLKKNISRFKGGAQNSTYSHSLILFKRKNNKPIRKILFPPSPCLFVFCYYFSLTLFFSLSSILTSNLYHSLPYQLKAARKKKVEKEKKNLKRKSITNQEDGTSFPPHKILKHLKDLKILSDPKI